MGVTLTISPNDVSILSAVGSFGWNFARAMLLVLCLLAFLAALALLAGSFLSFPVACLACFVLLVVGLTASFILKSTEAQLDTNPLGGMSYYAARAVLFFLPDFASASPTEALVEGLWIPWRYVLRTLGVIVGFQTLACLAGASIIFWRRELAAVVT